MKKSQLKQLIREVIQESTMSERHLEITESLETLIEHGVTIDDIRIVLDQLEEKQSEERSDGDGGDYKRNIEKAEYEETR